MSSAEVERFLRRTKTAKKVEVTTISPRLALQIALAAIPRIGLDTLAQRRAREKHVKITARQLTGVTVPTVELPAVISNINTAYLKALIEPGAAVGGFAAAALSQSIMQQNFNTFHFAGSNKTVDDLVGEYNKILNASREINPKKTFVYFNKVDMDRLDIVMANRKFSELYISDVVADATVNQIIQLDSTQRSWYYLFWDIYPSDKWSSTKVSISKTDLAEIPLADHFFFRIQLKVNTLFFNRISVKDVVDTIEREIKKMGTKQKQAEISALRIIHSPDIYGEIHIYLLDPAMIANLTTQDPTDNKIKINMFLNMVYHTINKMLIKGIPGIITMYPQYTSLWLSVSDVTRMEAKDQFLINFDSYTMKRHNIGFGRMISYFQYMRMRIVGYLPEDFALVVQTDGRIPDDIVETYDNAESKMKKEYDEKISKGIMPLQLQPGSMYSRYADRYFAVVEGGNMAALMADPDIDMYGLYSDSVSEMVKHWGILVTQNYLTDYLTMLSTDSNSGIDPVHNVLYANIICNLGVPRSYSYVGLRSSEVGAMFRATFERSVEEFSKGGAMGSIDLATNNIISSIIGTRPLIGSGLYPIISNSKTVESIRKRLQSQKLDTDKISQALDRYNSIASKTTDRMTEETEILIQAERQSIPIPVTSGAIIPSTVTVETLPAIDLGIITSPAVPLPINNLQFYPNLTFPPALLAELSTIILPDTQSTPVIIPAQTLVFNHVKWDIPAITIEEILKPRPMSLIKLSPRIISMTPLNIPISIPKITLVDMLA